MKLLLLSLSAVAQTALLAPVAASAAPGAPETMLAGTPVLYPVRGEVSLGRPTRYVTFKTAKGVSARLLVVTVSGSSGRTFNADDGRRERSQPRSRTCFRSSMNPPISAPCRRDA